MFSAVTQLFSLETQIPHPHTCVSSFAPLLNYCLTDEKQNRLQFRNYVIGSDVQAMLLWLMDQRLVSCCVFWESRAWVFATWFLEWWASEIFQTLFFPTTIRNSINHIYASLSHLIILVQAIIFPLWNISRESLTVSQKFASSYCHIFLISTKVMAMSNILFILSILQKLSSGLFGSMIVWAAELRKYGERLVSIC